MCTICSLPFIYPHPHTVTHHTHTPTHAVQDPFVATATSAQPGAGQDDYNPFTDERPQEEEPEVKCGSSIFRNITPVVEVGVL